MVFNYIRGTYVLGNPEGISISNPFFEMGVLWKNKSSATHVDGLFLVWVSFKDHGRSELEEILEIS